MGGPSQSDLDRIAREDQAREDERRAQENADRLLDSFVDPVYETPVVNIVPSVETQTTGNPHVDNTPVVTQLSAHDIWLARHLALLDSLKDNPEPESHLLYDI